MLLGRDERALGAPFAGAAGEGTSGTATAVVGRAAGAEVLFAVGGTLLAAIVASWGALCGTLAGTLAGGVTIGMGAMLAAGWDGGTGEAVGADGGAVVGGRTGFGGGVGRVPGTGGVGAVGEADEESDRVRRASGSALRGSGRTPSARFTP